MTSLKFEKIWELLGKYNFEIDSNSIHDLMCIICKKIIKNSRQSLCGCRYCYECIEAYLNGEEKVCPGPTKDCREHVLNLERDVQLDHVANMKVSRLILKCPEPSCQFTDELRNMEDHISSHQLNCPYLEIGCSSIATNSLNIIAHFRENEMTHSTLIIESIQNLKNELTFVKEESQRAVGTGDTVKYQVDNTNHSDVTMQLLKDVANCKVDNLKLTSDIKNLKNELEMLKKNHKEKETKLQQKLNKAETENKKALNDMKNDFQKLQQRMDNFEKAQSQIDDQKSSQMPKERRKPPSPASKASTAAVDIPSEVHAPFLWSINQFSEKRASAKQIADSFILSKAFYSHDNGYRMCLIAFPDGCVASGNKQFCVGFHIMKGPNDDRLPWPMMRTVTVGLVDQQSKAAFICEKYHHDTSDDADKPAFHRPTRGMNEPLKSVKFVNLNILTSNGKLCKNDCVVLSCVVE